MTKDVQNGIDTIIYDYRILPLQKKNGRSIYGVFMFRFQLTQESILWFNGIWLRKFHFDEILQITFYERKLGIYRIGIQTEAGEARFYNAFGADKLVEAFAQEYRIKVARKIA